MVMAACLRLSLVSPIGCGEMNADEHSIELENQSVTLFFPDRLLGL